MERQAKRYIRDAFAILEPEKACDRLMMQQTLDEIYGQRDSIMEIALQQVKRRSRSIEHERGSLLELKADLRNLKDVAASIGHEFALNNPQLLGQLYSAFCAADLLHNTKLLIGPSSNSLSS